MDSLRSYNETSSTSKEVSNKAFSTLAPPNAQHNATPSPSPSNAQYDASPSPFLKIVRKKRRKEMKRGQGPLILLLFYPPFI